MTEYFPPSGEQSLVQFSNDVKATELSSFAFSTLSVILALVAGGCSPGDSTTSAPDTDMSGMPSISAFLNEEFKEYGLEPGDSSALSHSDWTLERDQCGFTLRTAPEAFLPLLQHLDSVFPPSRFDSAEGSGRTLIFRDDAHHTTAMLAQGAGQTELIVLHWKDPAIRAAISQQQEEAISQLVDGALSKFHGMVDDAVEEIDEEKQAAKLDAALERAEEILSGLDSRAK